VCVLGAQEIQELAVGCRHAEQGCLWSGNIGGVMEHSKTCPFTPAIFTEDPVCLAQRELDSKLPSRGACCCTPGEVEGQSTRIFDKKSDKDALRCKPACSPQCGLPAEVEKMNDHPGDSCCHSAASHSRQLEKMCRKDRQLPAERANQAPLNSALEEELLSARNSAVTLKHGEFFGFKLSGFSRLKETSQRFYSASFYTCQKYKMRALVDCNGRQQGSGTHLAVSVEILAGRYDGQLDWPFQGVVSIVLLNQQDDGHHHEQLLALKSPGCCAQVGTVAGMWRYLPLPEVIGDRGGDVQYLVKDSLYFRVKADTIKYKHWLSLGRIDVAVEAMIREFKMLKTSGSITFKLQNYSKTVSSMVMTRFFIEPGYGCSIAVQSRGKHLAISASISQRPSGDSLGRLPWRVQVELLNQLENDNHHARFLDTITTNTDTSMTTMKSPEFIAMALLAHNKGRKTQYLKDNNLYFRVSLDPESNIEKKWLECTGEFVRCYSITEKKKS